MTERSDWCTMTAGNELDRVIAAQLGWTEVEEREIWHEDYEGGGFRSILIGVPPVANVIAVTYEVPHYSTDLNAAFTLPVEDLYFIDLHSPVGDPDYEKPMWNAWIEWIWEGEEDDTPDFQCDADTPALAVCRAWLAYRDAARPDDAPTGGEVAATADGCR